MSLLDTLLYVFMPTSSPDFTPELRRLMEKVGILTFTDFCRQCHIPRSQLTRLRQGQMGKLPLKSVQAIASTLKISLDKLIQTFELADFDSDSALKNLDPHQSLSPQGTKVITQLKREYEHLQQQLLTQAETCRESVQQEALDILESLLLFLPTAAHQATQNPTAPAIKLLPLLKPLNQLLDHWNIVVIGTVGEMIAFDPQVHQWMGQSTPPIAGEAVRVRYVGYQQGDRLLYRAKVS